MRNVKKGVQMLLNRLSYKCRKQTRLPGSDCGRINWETGTVTYTAVHKQVTNTGSLYGTGTQYSVITNMGKESKKHTTLQINYTPRKI